MREETVSGKNLVTSLAVVMALVIVVILVAFAAISGSSAESEFVLNGLDLPVLTQAVLKYRWPVALALPAAVLVAVSIGYAVTRRGRLPVAISWSGVALATLWVGLATLAYSLPGA